jgi:hypothetical protein
MNRSILAATAGVLLLATPAGPALAHDAGYYEDNFYHFLDHSEHQRFHEEFDEGHERAHEQGFTSPAEHRAWHRADGATHEQFHEDHPGTWHDHYPPRYYQWWGY